MSPTGLAFTALFLIGCALALARHPVFGLITYVTFFYVHPPSRWWGQGVLADIRWSLIAAGVTAVAVLLRRRELIARTTLDGRVFLGMVLFVVWILIQQAWAMDTAWQSELLEYYAKYLIAMYLIVRCVDSERSLRLFLWSHVLGCGYLGFVAFTTYKGGRFEGFGGPGLGEANVGALQIVTGILVAASLFLFEKGRNRLAVLAIIPLLVNALATTASRSGFLAMAVGGLAYVAFSPRQIRMAVIALSIPAAILFAMLTNAEYWERMHTIKYSGMAVENVDTGGGRLEIIRAQWQMFQRYRLGCGHRCTAFLSAEYLDDSLLTGSEDERGRSSHNTFMTLLVEQGVPGAVLYVGLFMWVVLAVRRSRRARVDPNSLVAMTVPAVGSAMVAIFVADMFVSNMRLEVRFWLIALLVALLRMSAGQSQRAEPGGANATSGL